MGRAREGGSDVKLIGILSWYDENPAWLAAVIASFAKAQVSHVVAVDGPYALFPDVRPASDSVQHDVIAEACRGAGMGVTLHIPSEPWAGNELEKRTFCFELAEDVANEWEDWYFICDADAYITEAIGHLERLEETDCDVAAISMAEDHGLAGSMPLRCIFRAIPGLQMGDNHYSYVTVTGTDLNHARTEACDLSMVRMLHRVPDPNSYRRKAQLAYYERRGRELVEA